jgi:hypothetical protein
MLLTFTEIAEQLQKLMNYLLIFNPVCHLFLLRKKVDHGWLSVCVYSFDSTHHLMDDPLGTTQSERPPNAVDMVTKEGNSDEAPENLGEDVEEHTRQAFEKLKCLNKILQRENQLLREALNKEVKCHTTLIRASQEVCFRYHFLTMRWLRTVILVVKGMHTILGELLLMSVVFAEN